MHSINVYQNNGPTTVLETLTHRKGSCFIEDSVFYKVFTSNIMIFKRGIMGGDFLGQGEDLSLVMWPKTKSHSGFDFCSEGLPQRMRSNHLLCEIHLYLFHS